MSRSRSSRGLLQDLDLRLGPSFISKGGNLTANFIRGFPEFIMIEDDDDDVQMFPPVSSRETMMFFPHPSSWVPVITEDDLELRLGVGAPSNGGTDISKDIKDPHGWKCGKASSSYYASDLAEVKLRCAICMDTMKEETSTVCGHVFCKPCITNAIRVQKRCPTCREKLSMSNIHRIYLPGTTS